MFTDFAGFEPGDTSSFEFPDGAPRPAAQDGAASDEAPPVPLEEALAEGLSPALVLDSTESASGEVLKGPLQPAEAIGQCAVAASGEESLALITVNIPSDSEPGDSGGSGAEDTDGSPTAPQEIVIPETQAGGAGGGKVPGERLPAPGEEGGEGNEDDGRESEGTEAEQQAELQERPLFPEFDDTQPEVGPEDREYVRGIFDYIVDRSMTRARSSAVRMEGEEIWEKGEAVITTDDIPTEDGRTGFVAEHRDRDEEVVSRTLGIYWSHEETGITRYHYFGRGNEEPEVTRMDEGGGGSSERSVEPAEIDRLCEYVDLSVVAARMGAERKRHQFTPAQLRNTAAHSQIEIETVEVADEHKAPYAIAGVLRAGNYTESLDTSDQSFVLQLIEARADAHLAIYDSTNDGRPVMGMVQVGDYTQELHCAYKYFPPGRGHGESVCSVFLTYKNPDTRRSEFREIHRNIIAGLWSHLGPKVSSLEVWETHDNTPEQGKAVRYYLPLEGLRLK
ncbi:MAG TPA: hypothetical protein VLF60_01485 [Candidatus Saccharimonadales bacterium]|nr:hypothetical protein [Candidatus Saccharimonadales bacterium]